MKEIQKTFRISTEISLRREDFGGLIFIPITGEILQLNRAGYNLLECVKDSGNFLVNSGDSAFWQELEKKGVIKEVISCDCC
jgi:hypothetical protein